MQYVLEYVGSPKGKTISRRKRHPQERSSGYAPQDNEVMMWGASTQTSPCDPAALRIVPERLGT